MKATTKAAIAATAFAVGGMIGPMLAPPAAHATPEQDVRYLRLVTSRFGLQFDSADMAISQAKAICSHLDSGYSLTSTAADVRDGLNLTTQGATWVVASAVVVYCPWNDPTQSPRTYLSTNATASSPTSTADAAL